METQIVRLDPPYNLICNKDAEFGSHIATLIITRTFEDGSYRICSYPVVEKFHEPGGIVWEDHMVETCHAICHHNEHITLKEIKNAVEYYYAWSNFPSTEFVWNLKEAIVSNRSHIYLPEDTSSDKKQFNHERINDFEVQLIFDNDKDSGVCTICSSDNSSFYFLGGIDYEPDARSHPGDDEETAIIKLARLRNTYLMAFAGDGVKSITFKTDNKEYQEFVEQLNNYPNV